MPTLLARNDVGTAGATSGGPGISLGVIIAVVIVGTVFVAVASGLLCTWTARRKRHKRRQSRRMEEEEARKKQMMTVTMMRDSDEGGRPADGQPVVDDAAATAAAAAAANYFRPGGAPISDCASSTCCSLASTRDSFSTMDGDFEGAGMVWWWMWRWRRFWHNQRRWVRRQKQRVPAVLGRTGSNSSGGSQGGGNEIKLQSQRNHCLHDHGHHGHHHHRRGTADGSPRKLRRRRPETSIIATTNSLFFPGFAGENDNNGNAIASNAASGEIGLREPPPTFSVVRANSFPQRPPPPSEQHRLLAPNNQPPPNMAGHNGPWYSNNASSSGNPNRSSMPNMPPRPQNPRYRPQQPSNPSQQRQHQQGPSLQPPPPISTRTLPRPPQPALIIPHQPESYIPPGVPFYPSMPAQQQHQMMVMMMQQQKVQLQQQIRQQHMQQQQQQQQNRLSRSGSKHASQPNYATEAALTEILRSTEQRLGQLQGQQQLDNLGSIKRASMNGPAKTTDAAVATTTSTAAADADNESIKRVSQTSGSDADSMVAARKNSREGGHKKDARDSSPILDAIPTALSSPSKSPNKNRVAAGTLTQAAGGSNVMAHPMMLPAPAVHLPAPTPSNLSNSSPETRSPSSAYSSSASSRSSLSTVYSVDERSDKGTVASRATSKGGVRIANSGDVDDDAQNDRILAGLGITGALTADSQLFAVEKGLERVQVSHAVVPGTDDTMLVPAALSTPTSRASRGLPVSAAAAPDLPPRSPRRSAGTVKKANGIMIPHSSSGNNLGSLNTSSMMNANANATTNTNTNNRNGANQGRSRHRRNGSVWQQAPSPQQLQQSGYNMMHNNSVRFTFGGPHDINSANSDNDDRSATASQGVRRMATSPSKRGANDSISTSSNNNNVSTADPSDEKTPSSAISIIPPSSPAAWRKSADRSLLQSSPTLAPEDEHSLVPRHANPRTSWGNGGPPPNPPRHRRRSLNERIEALQAIESEEAQFRRAVRPLPRPPSFGSLSNLTAINVLSQQMAQSPRGSYSMQTSQGSQKNHNSSRSNNNNNNNNMTVISAAAELRRMNSTAYSEASSCYSNATSAIGRSPAMGSLPSSAVHISTAASAMGLTQPRRVARRRNSSAGESASGMTNRSSAVGSRQYLALGKKRLSQVPSHSGGGYDKENRDALSKRSSAPPTASSSSSSSGIGGVSSRPAPQRTRSARSMTTTGTVLRRVDENPASGSTTPSSGTPNKTGGALTPSATAGSNLSVVATNASPSTPKANTGRPLRKSPSRSTQVGNAALPANGSPVSKLRTRSTMGPSTPPSARSIRQQAAASRDSLGLYDQDGFLLSSPARKV